MGTITLTIDTNAKTVSHDMSGVASATKNAEKRMSGLGKSAKRLIGVFGGAAGLSMIARGVANEFEQATRSAFEFTKGMTPLLALGDNIKNIRRVTSEVNRLALTTGVTFPEVQGTMFDLQSSTGNLSEEIRRELLPRAIELAKVNGTELSTSITALTKLYQIYGDEVNTVQRIQDKMQLAAENGAITFSQMAVLIPKVANAAQAMGMSLDDVLAGMASATVKGGDVASTLTGLRGVFLKMNKAQAAGVKLQGSFIKNMEAISALPSDIILKIFGDESIAVANSLMKNTEGLRDNLTQIRNVEAGITENKLKQRLEMDEMFAITEKIARMEREREMLRRGSAMGKGAEWWEETKTSWSRKGAGNMFLGAIASVVAPLSEALRYVVPAKTGEYRSVYDVEKESQQRVMEARDPGSTAVGPGYRKALKDPTWNAGRGSITNRQDTAAQKEAAKHGVAAGMALAKDMNGGNSTQ